MNMPAGKFKAHCLEIMDRVKQYGEEVVITKHGHPVAKLVPVGVEGKTDIFGYLKGTVTIKGNIVESTGQKWNAA